MGGIGEMRGVWTVSRSACLLPTSLRELLLWLQFWRSEVPEIKAKVLPGPVGFVGAGRVGTALAALLHARGVKVAGVTGRTLADGRRMALAAGLAQDAAKELAETLGSASIVFLTVPDDAITELCQEIADEGGWREGQGVVHCSGALPSSVLAPAREQGALVASSTLCRLSPPPRLL